MLELRRIALYIAGELALARELDADLENDALCDDIGIVVRHIEAGLTRGLAESDVIAMDHLIRKLQKDKYRNAGQIGTRGIS